MGGCHGLAGFNDCLSAFSAGTRRSPLGGLAHLLNNMEDAFLFDDLAIVGADGRQLFRYGHQVDGLPEFDSTQQAAWVVDPKVKRVYRVMRVPIWLGPDGGNGAILTYRALENQELAELAGQATSLQLVFLDRVIARSEPSGKAKPYVCRNGRLLRQAMIDYGCVEVDVGVSGVRMVIVDHLQQVFALQTIIIAGLLFLLVLGVAFHLVLGRWLVSSVRRVVALGVAAIQFDQKRQLDVEIRRWLASSTAQNDEISVLADSLERLMVSSVQREDEARSYLTTLEILQEAVIEIDVAGRLLRTSPAWAVLMNEEQRLDSVYDYLEPEDAELLRQQLESLFAGSKQVVNMRLRTAALVGQHYWLDCRFVVVAATRVCGVLRDITQTYLQERQITHMALHDALTGLPNRTLLEDRIGMVFSSAQRLNRKAGIGFIDLDHFKNVNDVLGHKAGDQLLLAITQRLQDCLRASDTLARWGGDEFVVLLGDMVGLEDIRRVAEKLAAACSDAIVLEGQNFPVTFSMGFSIFPDDGSDMETLLSQADRALFYAKAQGRNNHQFFSEMSKSGLGKKELYIQARLADAIKNGNIVAWFQPQVNGVAGEIVGMEALARWHDPALGWIPPATFIPMAENLGLIRELGDRIIHLALAMQARILELGHNITLSVNVSRRQLFFPQFEQTLAEAARGMGIDAHRVVLEITESIAMTEVAFSRQRLKAIHLAGFRIAIDDFGVGHSSLSQLHDMPLDELKIDMSFTRRVNTPQGAHMVQAIVAIADSLGIQVVAEGVEDVATSLRLQALGVSVLQGYLFGKPMSADEFVLWLQQSSSANTQQAEPGLDQK